MQEPRQWRELLGLIIDTPTEKQRLAHKECRALHGCPEHRGPHSVPGVVYDGIVIGIGRGRLRRAGRDHAPDIAPAHGALAGLVPVVERARNGRPQAAAQVVFGGGKARGNSGQVPHRIDRDLDDGDAAVGVNDVAVMLQPTGGGGFPGGGGFGSRFAGFVPPN